MPRVTPITCALIAAAAAWPVAAQGQDTTYSPWRTRGLPSPETQTQTSTGSVLDTSYIRTVVRGNLTEVALGRLADSHAQSSEVKSFAKQMVTDHDAMGKQWTDLSKSYKMPTGGPFTVDFGEAGKEAIDRLGKLKGSQFDQAYMAEMIQDHEQDLELFQRMRTSAQDSRIRDLASSGYSTISQHLSLARQVGGRVGVATTAGRVGGVTYPTKPAPTGTYRQPTSTTSPAPSESTERANAQTLSAGDRRFVEDVLGDHQLHVRLATIAQREAKDKETRELAQRVEKEMMDWGQRWQGFSDRRGGDITSSLERQDRNKIERLRDVKEKNFDQAYAHIVANHMERMLNNFRNARWDRRSDVAGRIVQKELPVLRDLHQRAAQLEEKLDRENDRSGKDKK